MLQTWQENQAVMKAVSKEALKASMHHDYEVAQYQVVQDQLNQMLAGKNVIGAGDGEIFRAVVKFVDRFVADDAANQGRATVQEALEALKEKFRLSSFGETPCSSYMYINLLVQTHVIRTKIDELYEAESEDRKLAVNVYKVEFRAKLAQAGARDLSVTRSVHLDAPLDGPTMSVLVEDHYKGFLESNQLRTMSFDATRRLVQEDLWCIRNEVVTILLFASNGKCQNLFCLFNFFAVLVFFKSEVSF